MSHPLRDGYPGWTELVVSVRDFARIDALTRVGGWQLLHAGAAEPALAAAWGLAPGTVIRERLLHVPTMPYGYLRFACIDGASGAPIRPADARPWDTGGLWLIYTRARDDAALSRALTGAGWPSPRGVHGFEFGGLSVREVHHLGPDGMVLSTIEQIAPPLEVPVPQLTHAFNAAVLVRDLAAAKRFYIDILGFRPWMEVSWPADNPGLTLLADLDDFRGMDTVDTVIVHPHGENLGSVELIGWSGARQGRDFSARARPPNLGSLALRFPVASLDERLGTLARHGVAPAAAPVELVLPPYGRVRLAPVVAPDGIWLEFFEVL
jgi:catechol 2,3-dioxygenase-like lactoylglutathione lyase family enzyme